MFLELTVTSKLFHLKDYINFVVPLQNVKAKWVIFSSQTGIRLLLIRRYSSEKCQFPYQPLINNSKDVEIRKIVYKALCCDRSKVTSQLVSFQSQNLSLV